MAAAVLHRRCRRRERSPRFRCGGHPAIMKTDVERLALCISAEFQEMPGLRLTMPQAQRLWSLDGDTCAEVVAILVGRSILQRQAETIKLADS